MDSFITENEKEKIINHFGLEFYKKVLKDTVKYGEKWELKELKLIESFSVNCIFTCCSKRFGDAVLKIGKSNKALISELSVLETYKGKGFGAVFTHDIENAAILLERIVPGIRLREEPSLDKRLAVFSALYQGLHTAPKDLDIYPSYFNWVSRITACMSKREEYRALYGYMKKAEGICKDINNLHKRQMLLHGDLHHDNILLGRDGRYKIIDPKGVTGDPVFDIARFILNEVEAGNSLKENYNKICHIIAILEKKVNVPQSTICRCFFIETAMANCWYAEDGLKPDMAQVQMAEDIATELQKFHL